jgi:hypothetical protein
VLKGLFKIKQIKRVKMKTKLLSAIIALAPLFFLLSCKNDKVVTFESLLHEIVDRDVLPRYPDPFYITRQFSSYDRRSVAPDEPGWFANWDLSYFLRVDTIAGRREFVMMDAEGPGAIVRFWMTFAGRGAGLGTLRIYFDHEDEPSIVGSAFDVISGGQLTGKPLSTSVSPLKEHQWRGHNLYLPLPYVKHVKVTYESEHVIGFGKRGGEMVYFNINYRTYEPGTLVETFSLALLEKSGETLNRINETLNNRNKKPLEFEKASTIQLDGVIDPGSIMEYKISGTKAIREIMLQLEAVNLPQAHRSLVMEIEFDGNRTVWCPVGDFFGTGYQVRKVDTWYTHVTEDGLMHSYWVMPFKKDAVLRFYNYSDEPVQIKKGSITTTPWKWDKRSMHFGSTWLNYVNKFTGGFKTHDSDDGPFDFNYSHLKGKGVVVGDVLTLFNTAFWWWGEGDEKIYIDGEDFPSHFGTGTEDYYGYAWCAEEIFNEPFIAQPDGEGATNPGYVVNIRSRSLDAMPFTTEIKFDMEMWHWQSTSMDFAPATFFYLKPGGQIMIDPDIQGAREKVAIKREDIISPYIVNNVIEGENLIAIEYPERLLHLDYNINRSWSNNQILRWQEATKGSFLKLGFKCAKIEAGLKNVRVRLLMPSHCIIELSVNGSAPLKIQNTEKVGVQEFNLGTHEIKHGLNQLQINLISPGNNKEKLDNKDYLGIDKLSF